jgi:hypothetical protein
VFAARSKWKGIAKNGQVLSVIAEWVLRRVLIKYGVRFSPKSGHFVAAVRMSALCQQRKQQSVSGRAPRYCD